MFAKKLRVRMAEKGVTIPELADMLDVSEITLRAWLIGKRIPRLERWGMLESMFGDDLFDNAITTTSLPPNIPRASLTEDPEDIEGPAITEAHYGAPADPEPEPEPEPEIGPAHYGETL